MFGYGEIERKLDIITEKLFEDRSKMREAHAAEVQVHMQRIAELQEEQNLLIAAIKEAAEEYEIAKSHYEERMRFLREDIEARKKGAEQVWLALYHEERSDSMEECSANAS